MPEPSSVLPEVLIADDEEGICFSLRRLLDRKGYVVRVAADGREAVEVVRRHGDRIGIAFLDVAMPRLGGLAAMAEIQALVPGVRCCLMTAHRPEVVGDWFRGTTTTPVLDKPFALSEFLTAFGELLARGKCVG